MYNFHFSDRVIPVLILLIVVSFKSYSQDKSIKFGNVPADDIAMTVYEAEPEAEAVVLAKTTDLVMNYQQNGFVMIYKNFKRIKILKESAFDRATIEFDYYHKNRREIVTNLKALITYPDGSSYKLKKDEIYKTKADNSWTNVKFTFPKLEEGVIIEYSYDLKSEDIFTLEDFYFQFDIPTRYADLRHVIPENIDYIFLRQGIEYITQTSTAFVMEDVPSMKEESFITTMNDYRGRIKMQIKGYRDSYGVFNPITSTWGKLVESLYDDRRFGHQIEKASASNKFVSLAKPILDSDLTDKDKILKLQNFLLDNVTCNGDYGLYSTDGLEDAFEAKEASHTELNFMMICLLKQMGITAYPFLISTRNQGKLYTGYPFIAQFSYAIIYAEVDGKPMLIDVEDENRPPGIVSFSTLNTEGLIANIEGPSWFPIEPKKGRDLFLFDLTVSGDTLKGILKGKYDLANAIMERKLFEADKEGEHWKNRIQEKFSEAEIVSAKCENENNLYESFRDELEVNIIGACVDAGDIVYIDPFIYSNYAENPFKIEERNFPVDFGRPFQEQYVFSLQIPEGYTVDELPEKTAMTTEDRSASFQLSAATVSGKVQIVKKIDIKKSVYTPEEYGALKKLFDLMIEKSGEQIVLKKI